MVLPDCQWLRVAIFHPDSACASRGGSDSGGGTRTRRGCGKLEHGKTLIGACYPRLEMPLSDIDHDRIILRPCHDSLKEKRGLGTDKPGLENTLGLTESLVLISKPTTRIGQSRPCMPSTYGA